MAASTLRVQARAGCHGVLLTYQAAHTNQLAHVLDHRPGSFRTPLAFIDNIILAPSISHDSGLRATELIVRVIVVNKLVSNDQAADEQDVLLDGLEDAFSNTPRATSASTLTEPISTEPVALSDADAATYAASAINVRVRELVGR